MRKRVETIFALKNGVLTVNYRALGIFFLIFCTVQLSYLDNIGFSTFYSAGYFLALAYVIIVTRRVKISPVIALILLYNFSVCMSTSIYSGISLSTLVYFVTSSIYPLLLDTMLKRNAEMTINVMAFFFELAIYINFVAELFFPKGLYNTSQTSEKMYYLFGQQNQLGLYLLIAFTLGALRVALIGKGSLFDLRLLLLYVIGTLSAIKIWSVTTVIGCLIYLGIYFFSKLFKERLTPSVFISLIGNMVFFVVVVVLRNMSWMTGILNLLGREENLSGRTRIWDAALYYVIRHPIFGVGRGMGDTLFGFSSSHNRYLNTLFIGGIVAFGIFIVLLIYVCRIIERNKSNSVCNCLAAYMWAVLVMFQFETYSASVIFTVFIVAQNINYIRNDQEQLIACR